MFGITSNQFVYAAKIYVAAMLAYFFAVELGLTNPYWAIVTCCVLGNPLSGLLQARALYRFVGTIAAGALSLLLSVWLINEPVLLIVVTGLTSALILAFSFADRTPRAYSYQLAGVTMMLVLIAYMSQPETMFSMVTTRVLEICIGILAITFVDSIWKPGSNLSTLSSRKNNWISNLKKWREDSLRGLADHSTDTDRIKLLSDVSSLSQLVSTMKYDYSIERITRQSLIALQQKLIVAIPRIAAIGHAMSSLTPEIRERVLQSHDWFELGSQEQNSNFSQIPDAIYEQATPWERLVLAQLDQLLQQHIDDWAELMELNQLSDGHPVNEVTVKSVLKAKALPLVCDTGLMARMFGGILLTYLILCWIWYVTGWIQGPNLVLLGVVAIAFFGATDEPGATIKHFGRFTFFSIVMAFILGYVLLPLANTYSSFLLIMAIYMLPLGIWASKNPLALLALALSLSTINLQSHYAPFDIGYFVESAVASLIGIYVAFVSASAFRRWGAKSALEQLLKREDRDLLKLAERFDEQAIRKYAIRSMDRMALQVSRLGASADHTSLIGLANICANAYSARLRQAVSENSELQFLTPLLTEINQNRGQNDSRSTELVNQIDLNLQKASEQGLLHVQRLLTGLRLALFPHSPNWNFTHV